jgi:Leucine-rich repeat (LRR) protein
MVFASGISVLENLDPLTSLTKLDLSGNELLAVSNAQQLTNLQQLYLQNNKM